MAINHCYPGAVINGGNEKSSATWKLAQEAGSKVGRCNAEFGATMKIAAEVAKANGMVVCWQINISSKTATLAATATEYNALTSEQKALILCTEWGNENWGSSGGTPEFGIGPFLTGDEYGTSFINAAAEQRAKCPGMPLAMQCRIAPPTKDAFMESMFSKATKANKPAELKTALIGNGTEATPQNYLQSHPYGTGMMIKLKEPTNLANCHDANGGEWCSQRWMQEAQYVRRETGLNCSSVLTEWGTNYEKEGYSVTGTRAKELWEFLKLVKEGKVPSANLPSAGYVPKCMLVTYYSLMGNKYTGTKVGNPFGLVFYPSERNEEGTPKVWVTFKTGAETVTAASEKEPGVEEPPVITSPGEQSSTVGVSVGTVTIKATHCTSLKAEPLPAGLTLGGTAENGTVTGTPTKAETVTVTVTAKGAGGESTTTFNWAVTASEKGTGLLVGDATSSYAEPDQTSTGRVEAFAFTAAQTGTVKELQFRTGAASTGITKVILGVIADAAGKPAVQSTLGEGETTANLNQANVWLKVTGLKVPVVAGSQYWLAMMPIGGQMKFNSAVASGGTAAYESPGAEGAHTVMSTVKAWTADTQGGPVGFQALGEFGAPIIEARFAASAELAGAFTRKAPFKAKAAATAGLRAAVSTPHRSFEAVLEAAGGLVAALSTPRIHVRLRESFEERLDENMGPWDS